MTMCLPTVAPPTRVVVVVMMVGQSGLETVVVLAPEATHGVKSFLIEFLFSVLDNILAGVLEIHATACHQRC